MIESAFKFAVTPTVKWKWAPFGDFYALTIMLTCDPHWLARWTCRVMLGSKWERVKA